MSNYVFVIIGLTILSSFLIFLQKKDAFYPLVIFPIAYVYFTMGPVITHVTGGVIYAGIVVNQIDAAMYVFIFALIGMGISAIPLLDFQPPRWDINVPGRVKKRALLYITYIATFVNLVSLFFIVTNLSVVLGGVKGSLLRAVPRYAFWHFNYLMFWSFCVALFLTLDTWKTSKLLIFNFFFYCVYCLLLDERDFVLIFFAILAYRTRLKKMSLFSASALSAGISVVFVLLVWTRNNEVDVNFVDLYLKQGNNLNIITNILSWSETWLEPKYGWTYIQSLLNLAPSFIFRSGKPLSDWFKNEFAPDSNSGYGFSLEGEAYMNFGYVGVLLFFFLFGKVLIYFYNSKQKGSFFGCYMYYYSLLFAIYTLRGDSLMLFKGFAYATGFYYFIMFLANHGRITFRPISKTQQKLE